jgi:hypothetical protein
MLFGDELHLRKLIRPHAACANVSDFPALDQIMQCFHRFFHRRLGIKPMDLQQSMYSVCKRFKLASTALKIACTCIVR